jgi:Raf kinase inhibitor-like YbhB/YbcL family protein
VIGPRRTRPVAAALCLLMAACGSRNTSNPGVSVDSPGAISLTSPDFVTGATIPLSSTCEGAEVPPTLSWSGGPAAQEFALTVIDRDAHDFVHWLIWRIPGDAPGIAADRFPPGVVQGRNSLGKTGYAGPCPPPGGGAHRYVFTVYALSAPSTGLSSGATLDQLFQAVNGTVEASGTLIGTFARAKAP